MPSDPEMEVLRAFAEAIIDQVRPRYQWGTPERIIADEAAAVARRIVREHFDESE